MFGICFGLFVIILAVNADVYLHFPPGSNNRVNENTAKRTNANNAFDSQNNDKGGYNVPDATSAPYGTNASLQYYLVSLKHAKDIDTVEHNLRRSFRKKNNKIDFQEKYNPIDIVKQKR